jgi:hypothetical protein
MDLMDVETELRTHLTSRPTPLAPEGLVERTRLLHRRRRRQQAAVVGVGLAVALLFGSVPVLRAALPDVGRSDTAAPSTAGLTSLYDLPARGSLADDGDWLDAVAALPWAERPGVDQDTQPPVDSHRVLYAADVQGSRVALVAGRDGAVLSSAWFTGPTGADPDELTQAAASARAYPDQPITLLDVPAGGDTGLLVVLTRPGDRVSYVQGLQVAADGSTTKDLIDLPVTEGVAVATLPAPGGLPGEATVVIDRAGQQAYSIRPATSDRAVDAALAPIAVSDPRGLRSGITESALQGTARLALSAYGSGAEGVTPVVLAAGTLAGDGEAQALLVGITFPSGATALWASRSGTAADGSGTSTTTSLDPVPAGTPLLDRTAAVRVSGSLLVTAPAGAASAVVLASDGTTVTTVPLVRGSGVTDLLPAPAPVAYRVQVLDAAGGVLAEAQVQGTE